MLYDLNICFFVDGEVFSVLQHCLDEEHSTVIFGLLYFQNVTGGADVFVPKRLASRPSD